MSYKALFHRCSVKIIHSSWKEERLGMEQFPGMGVAYSEFSCSKACPSEQNVVRTLDLTPGPRNRIAATC